MLVIPARNVNDAWYQAKVQLNANHIRRSSRVGEVLEYPTPVMTIYEKPQERVLFDSVRDCNPFFHLMEALWMLAGRNDVAWIAQFNKRMHQFSDDGTHLAGAYGWRWRRHFRGISFQEDQLPRIVNMLRRNHNERRAVLTMWDPQIELDQPNKKDLCCNTHIYFKVRNGKLTMTVCNRSNDIVWGLFGANYVHMSMLMEYMAAQVGLPMGEMCTVSDSFHAYTEYWSRYGGDSTLEQGPDYYTWSQPKVEAWALVDQPAVWDYELQQWFANTESPQLDEPVYVNSFFPHIVQPLYNAWQHWKAKEPTQALASVNKCLADDWRTACRQWMERRVAHQQQEAQSTALEQHI